MFCLHGAGPAEAAELSAGDHERAIPVDGTTRSYLVHVPSAYQPDSPAPVVLILHGAGMNARMMVPFCGMNEKSDETGFLAVYANGTGVGFAHVFNAGHATGPLAKQLPNDVHYMAAVLDDLASVARVDAHRIYATGFSNGGMMCYRLAAEMADRIAAIAPVSGTLSVNDPNPARPVPLLHLHGTADSVVPFDGPDEQTPEFLKFQSVASTIHTWVRINHCQSQPTQTELADRADDQTTVTRTRYPPLANGAEVQLITIHGGGHTWPGREPPVPFIGRSTQDISANDVIWEFFSRHRLP